MVRKACANRYGTGALQVRRGAVRMRCGHTRAPRPSYTRTYCCRKLSAASRSRVGEDHLDHDQISHLGHVNTRCATIRSQYRIAPRRLARAIARACRARPASRTARTAPRAPHRTAPHTCTCIHYCRGSLDVRC